MRSLRTKMVMILVLLILALMTVVGSFLINGVGNYYIDDFYDQMNRTFSQDFILQLQELAEESPLGRNGNPKDVAKSIAYLADAEFVTGQVLSVNGGLVI